MLCTSCGVLVGVNDDTCYNCGRRNPGLWGFAPALRSLGNDMGFVPFVIGTCVILYALTLVVTVAQGGSLFGGSLFGMLSPGGVATFLFGSSGKFPVIDAGRWWTLLSAGWLHGSALHILFNMSVVRQMAPIAADLYGPGRMVIIYTAGSVAGFAASTLAGLFLTGLPWFLSAGTRSVGASASIAGLIAAILYYGNRGGSGMARQYASSYILMLVFIGLFLPNVDNYGHLGGFGGGYLMARYLDPLKPERIDHIAIAVVCLAASLLAIVVSVIHGLPILRAQGLL